MFWMVFVGAVDVSWSYLVDGIGVIREGDSGRLSVWRVRVRLLVGFLFILFRFFYKLGLGFGVFYEVLRFYVYRFGF